VPVTQPSTRTGRHGSVLLETLAGTDVDAINEPHQIECGAPDFIVVRGTVPRDLFSALLRHGKELIGLHTMQVLLPRITRFDIAGSNEVVKVRWADEPRSSTAGQQRTGRVYINEEQYFGAVPSTVWEMHIGGYRVAEKWLKDRKGRQLSYDDLTHYQSVIAALERTLALQQEIDSAIELAGGWPLQ